MRWKKYYRYAAAGILSCLLLTGCSKDTHILVTENKQEAEKNTTSPENTDNGTPNKDFPAFAQKSISDNPRTFRLTFPADMPEKKIEAAWKKISESPICEKAAMVKLCGLECFLETPPENINPEYLEWAKDSQGTDNPADPEILKDPAKLRITSVYTVEGTEENLLFGLNPGDSSMEAYSKNLVVNYMAGENVTIITNVVANTDNDLEPPSISQEEHPITLDRISTEADWMYDFPGEREERLCLKLCKKDFDKIAPKTNQMAYYYVKSVKGKVAELRKYVKDCGGYDYIDSYFE